MWLRLLLGLALIVGVATPAAARPAAASVPADRWMEIDLYWFDPLDVDTSVDRFWQRYTPLYRDVAGYKGVVLNVGLTVDFIMSYSGDLDQPIALPKGDGQELGVDIAGQLDGDTAARQQAWRARFSGHANGHAKAGYGAWTYRRLAQLAAALRRDGRRHGIADFRVATFAAAAEGAYGEKAPFAVAHPEAWTRWGGSNGVGDSNGFFDPEARLKADPTPRGGLPHVIAAGASVADTLAAQWGALSRQAGLDGLMLRDFFGFARAYTRYGPWGASVPNPARAAAITAAVGGMIRAIKLANPRALTMMYSSAATATGDWRGNGLDLEAVARGGYLDIFVDQTWAGAWGEAGVRQQTFWNAPILGWTYQLAYMLEHSAVLATSNVRHYHLVETFDAWESWDTIHTAPERLRWGIWAYSHAAVKTPDRIRMPEGAYISWGNHGQALLGEADIGFLARELNAAERDAAQVTEVFGPTLVYARDAAQQQMVRGARGDDARDRIDETVGSMIKWPLPVQSITRIEWLPKVRSDLFVFGATAGIAAPDAAAIADRARAGQPMAFLSAPTDTDPALALLAGVSFAPYRPAVQDRVLRATKGDKLGLAVTNIPDQFDAEPPPAQMRATPGTAVYSVGPSVALSLNETAERSIAFWQPIALDDTWYVPVRRAMKNSPAAFALASATLNRQLAQAGAVHAAVTDLNQSSTIAVWRTRDGSVSILAGNLEEGLRDDAERSRHVEVTMPEAWRGKAWRSVWNDRNPVPVGSSLPVPLAPQASRLFQGR